MMLKEWIESHRFSNGKAFVLQFLLHGTDKHTHSHKTFPYGGESSRTCIGRVIAFTSIQ